LSKLRGQIEVTSYEIEQAQKRQRDLYVDLDTRLRKLETVPQEPAQAPGAAVDSNTPAPLPPTISPNVAATPMPKLPPSGNTRTVAEAAVSAEQQAYDAASEQFRAGKYPEALAQFQAFLKTFPKSPLAPSAQYWVGNAYYAQRDFAAAIAAQRALIRGFPDSQKAPDALLNIASAQTEQGDTAAARKTLEELLARYPQAEAADKAKKRLAGAR
jgi:tol-pal system protein YbgF